MDIIDSILDALKGIGYLALLAVAGVIFAWIRAKIAQIADDKLRQLALDAVEYIEGLLEKLTGKDKFEMAVTRLEKMAPELDRREAELKIASAVHLMQLRDAKSGFKVHGKSATVA